METIILSILNNPKDGATLVSFLGLFLWCFSKFKLYDMQIKNIIETQEKDNNAIIDKLNEFKKDIKEDIKNLSDNLFEYIRSQK